MAVTVAGRKMTVTDALRQYADEKIGNSMKVMDINPLDAEVVLSVEKNPSNPVPATCEVTLRTKGHVIHVEESEEDMYAAIDVAAATGAPDASGDVDFDALMDELSADDAILRVKEIDFEPLTEEEALVKIDLLDHDFFVYTDRDSGQVNVIYRRKNGGYGKLMPKE